MMKNDKLFNTEIENLSAYLDHELSESEEAHLRSRLAQDAELREKLEDLRLTRYTLMHTPKVRRQRSFTLSPEMVQKQRFAWRAVNFSRMVSAAASVLFVLVLGGELLFGSSAGMLASAPADNAAMVQDSAAVEAPMAMEALQEEPAMEPGVDEPAAAEPAAEAASGLADEATPPVGMGGGIEPTATLAGTQMPVEEPLPQSTEFGIGGGAPPTETLAPPSDSTEEERMVPSEKEPDITAQDDALFSSEMVEGEPSDIDSAEMASESEVREQAPIPIIRWVQAGLLVLALLSGTAAVYFRRTAR